ncbi:MAG: non-heme iron oxygenase ferredoxin subunit [Proteobacteria bacterium]|nr:non-heme iron oxygenase ferredoxin subunit [Pseudomonadota bacterium]
MNEGNWHKVATRAEIMEEEPIRVVVGDTPIALYEVEGELYATHDVCTHAEASLSEGIQEGDTIECPMHSGCFNIRTGEAVGPPVTEDIKTYQVRLEGDDVLVRVD